MKKEDLEKMSLCELTELSKNIDSIRSNKIKEEQENFRKWENRPLGKLQSYISKVEQDYKKNSDNYPIHGGCPTLSLLMVRKNGEVAGTFRLLSIGNGNDNIFMSNVGIGIAAGEEKILEMIKLIKSVSSPKLNKSLKELFK